MLKKVLYNKFKILNIPHELNLDSEEFMKILFDLKNVVMFKYGDELRLLTYTGFNPDYYGRSTQFQPIAFAGNETYDIQTLESCVKYQENAFRGCAGGLTSYGFIEDDIDNYICILSMLDEAVVINSKQVKLPFIASASGTDQKQMLEMFLKTMFGEDYKNMIVKKKMSTDGSVTIEPTNMQVFLQQIQDTKKKVLDEAFFYLGVASPQGKLAHQSELEIEKSSRETDLLNDIMFDKIKDFLDKCNLKFDLKMSLETKLRGE